MMKNAFKTVALAAVTFGWIAVAAAQPPDGGPRRGPGHPGGPGFGPGDRGPGGPPIERIAEQLGLTEEQEEQWKTLHEKERESARPLIEAAENAREAFDKALNAENADATAVGNAALAMRAAGRKLEAHHKAAFESVKAILTPEQLAKLEEHEKRGRRPGPGGPGAPGFGAGPKARRPGPGSR